MSRVLYRCCNCFDQGRERTFKTPSGYKEHLRGFHAAKEQDLVNIIASEQQAPTNGDGQR